MPTENFYLGGINIKLLVTGDTVRLLTSNKNVLFANQSVAEVREALTWNYKYAISEYTSRLIEANELDKLNSLNLEALSFECSSYYTSLYDSWRIDYPKRKDKTLTIKPVDLDSFGGRDIVVSFFSDKKFVGWKDVVKALLKMNDEELERYLINREHYLNK